MSTDLEARIHFLSKRPRRNRKSSSIRSLLSETVLHPSDFVHPFFVLEGVNQRSEIRSLPGVFRLSIDCILKEIESLYLKGILTFALFPVIDPALKDEKAIESCNPDSLVCRAIKQIKGEFPDICLISDVALDPFTSHGHDGLLDSNGYVDNDSTVKALIKQSLAYAGAGCDILAPSDMMDGRVGLIRKYLDQSGYTLTSIMSYTAKYASFLYNPFREAVDTSLLFGDKATYQMDPSNRIEALREAHLDEQEGADMLIVKPALFCLDVISAIKDKSLIPVGAYHVSGEYSMVMAAHQNGFLDCKKTFYESFLCIKRAGADFIFTYAAPQIIDMLR